ncbi:hypothetical protein MTR67_033627 [Solanum verrucosum]|uniref:Reverse transcriptase domain-containing protein n=1 Tax=Solanum verrucosum TaxID=315347 RepID=A0AAF0U6Q5_SOLVR|nr:hypothetical protein MTR67_033627 [Solanum verrucosum]
MISEGDNIMLQSQFTEDEIKDCVMACAGDKAPGPDGYTMAFFITCWEVVKKEVVAAVQNFHDHGIFERSFNATFIALIPKKIGAKELTDFRPISLIGSIYKIISKVLTERLKKVVHNLVDAQQMAFIKGRQIMDAILIANECVEERKNSKVPGILCKLDIEKAYDHLHWGFLWKSLENMDFGGKWLKWIKFCTTTVKFSILINGAPSGFFSSERGLRQGDPLSPFLFILAMEGLNDMLRTAQTRGWIRGFNANMNNRQGLAISHLQYADDTLIFCDADSSQLKYLRVILILFEAISGLHINWRKSFIFPVNEVPRINMLANILGGKIGDLPTTYLGMPLGDKSRSKGIWNNILEKCEKKLVNWKSQYLSLGGRVTLINSVLDALPTYMMSVFHMPANVIDRMDAIRRNFLWQGNCDPNNHKFHLVKWDQVILSKKEGGLGIRNLKIQNQSLLMKWLWRFASQEQALWKETIKARFGMENLWITNLSTQPYGAGVWRSIRNLWIKFFNKCKIKVGNGGRTLFWEDKWVDQVILRNRFPILFNMSLQKEATIREMRDNQGWDLRFRRHLNDWEVNKIVELLNILGQYKDLNTDEDNLFWNPDEQGRFSIGSAYRSSQRPGTHIGGWPWKMIWKVKIPLKIACFTWLLANQAALTQHNLMKRGMQICSRCWFCECEVETINHLFLHCREVAKLWQIFINLRGISWTMPRNIKEALACWNRDGNQSGHRERWKIVPACIWWSIWMERNQRCFKNKSCSMQNLKLNCMALFFFWCKHEYPQDAEDIPSILEFL